jgi:hypothetical protein
MAYRVIGTESPKSIRKAIIAIAIGKVTLNHVT